jgi:hypothetical protein
MVLIMMDSLLTVKYVAKVINIINKKRLNIQVNSKWALIMVTKLTILTKNVSILVDIVVIVIKGKGVLRCKKCFIYEGEFDQNMRHGYGELNEFNLNQIYKGSWYKNEKHGEGVQSYPDGSSYTGGWIKNKRQGNGEWSCLDGTIYDGQWRNDMMNGQGFYKMQDGFCYEGQFLNNLPLNGSTRLEISCKKQVNFEEGTLFSDAIIVKCLNDNGDVVVDGKKTLISYISL